MCKFEEELLLNCQYLLFTFTLILKKPVSETFLK